jgi:hypothetical protein
MNVPGIEISYRLVGVASRGSFLFGNGAKACDTPCCVARFLALAVIFLVSEDEDDRRASSMDIGSCLSKYRRLIGKACLRLPRGLVYSRSARAEEPA